MGLGPREYGAVVAILLAGVGFLAPTLWAWSATESLNQAAAFTSYNDALASLRGTAPSLILGMSLGTLVGTYSIAAISFLAFRGAHTLVEASPARLRFAVGLSVALGLILVVASSLLRWSPSLVAGGTAVALLALVPVATASIRSGTARARVLPWWIWRFLAAVGLSLFGMVWIAQGLRPVPTAEVKFPNGDTEVVLLVRATPTETVFLRPIDGETSFATGTLTLVVAPGAVTSIRYCSNTPVAKPFVCD